MTAKKWQQQEQPTILVGNSSKIVKSSGEASVAQQWQSVVKSVQCIYVEARNFLAANLAAFKIIDGQWRRCECRTQPRYNKKTLRVPAVNSDHEALLAFGEEERLRSEV